MRQRNTRNRQDVIAGLIEKHRLRYCAEIGVGTGPTTDAILSRFRDVSWLAVDCWPADLPLHYGGSLSADQQKDRRAAFLRVAARHVGRVTLLEDDTVKAAGGIKDGSLDLVFIDADHSYDGCKADILAWRPKLRAGGWLLGHDYCQENFPGVVKAVDELVPDAWYDSDYVWGVQV